MIEGSKVFLFFLLEAPFKVNFLFSFCMWVCRKTYRHPRSILLMEFMSSNSLRDGVRPLCLQGGRAPSPVPRMDSPYTTEAHPPHRRQVASCSSKRSTLSSGKTNKTPLKSHSSASGSENGERNGTKQNLTTLNMVHFNICGLSTKKDEFKHFYMKTK